MISDKLIKLCSRSYLRKTFIIKKVNNRLYSDVSARKTSELFFMDTVQDLLKKLTRVDIEKVYAPKKEGSRFEPPTYKFMTTAEYEQARKEAEIKAVDKLQMPPVIDKREECNQVLVKDDNLIGYSDCKFIFTDITHGVNDRVRNIVVRDEDGTLREASWAERDRMNQVYFPRPGRKLYPSKMFNKENMLKLLERGEYIFLLDSACCQFEPDDPIYIDVCQETYKAVDSDCAYNKLRSTRHFGPFAFYLAQNRKIDNLLMENIVTDRLEDAVWLISLYHILYPESRSASKPLSGDEYFEFIENYIKEDSENKVKLELTLQTYKEYLQSTKLESAETGA